MTQDRTSLPAQPDFEYRSCPNCPEDKVPCYRDRAGRLRMHPHDRQFVIKPKPKSHGTLYGRTLPCEQSCELAEGEAVGCAEVIARREEEAERLRELENERKYGGT